MNDRGIRADIKNLRRQKEQAGSAEERVMLDLILGDRQADLERSVSQQKQRPLPPRPGRG